MKMDTSNVSYILPRIVNCGTYHPVQPSVDSVCECPELGTRKSAIYDVTSRILLYLSIKVYFSIVSVLLHIHLAINKISIKTLFLHISKKKWLLGKVFMVKDAYTRIKFGEIN